MQPTENYDLLKLKLRQLGFNDPGLDNKLRAHISSGDKEFSAYFEEAFPKSTFWAMPVFWFSEPAQTFEMHYYEAGLKSEAGSYSEVFNTFSTAVTKDEACQVLAKQYFMQFDSDESDLSGFEKSMIEPFLARDNPRQINFFKQLNQDDANMQNEVNYYELKQQLRDLGCSDGALLKDLENEIKRGEAGVTLLSDLRNKDDVFSFEPNFGKEAATGFYQLADYHAYLIPTNLPIEHGTYNSVNTRDLDGRMAATEWNSEPMVKFIYEKPELKGKAFTTLIHDLFALGASTDPVARYIQAQLKVRHWSGTMAQDCISEPGESIIRKTARGGHFEPDISLASAHQYLKHRLKENIHFLDPQPKLTSNQINSINMNTQNLEFLKKSLLNLGFGEKVNSELERQIEKKTPEFALGTNNEFNKQKVAYNLHFKAGDTDGMYFFNKYDATLKKGTEKEQSQTFYINKGNGITAKEAFNLMEGRAVHKQLFNKEGERYQAWLQLDDKNLTQNGNKEIKRFNENYGYDLEKTISNKGIKEMETPEGKENLLKSLNKGNAQQITVSRNGEETKYFIAASPQFKTVDLYDDKMKKIKREELSQPEQKKSNDIKQGKQQKEELPGKKQQSKRKMSV